MQARTNRCGVSRLLVIAVVCVMGLVAPAGAQRSGANPNAVAIADFMTRVNDYVSLQKKLAEKVGPVDESKTPEQIAAREKALGEAIRAPRAAAVFT
jgi:hypothetical protein